jgi:hypothetical protein
MQTLYCAAGLLGGLALGAFIIYVSGLWNKLEPLLGKPLDTLTTTDLVMVGAPFFVVLGCGWLGARWGMRMAAKLEE